MTDDIAEAAPKKGTIFVGSKGLRAIWSVLIFVAIAAACGFGINIALKLMHHIPSKSAVMDPIHTSIGEGIGVVILTIATVVTALITRRSLGQLGFGLKNALWRFIQGLVVGFVMLSALVGALYLCHAFVIDKIALHGMDVLTYGWQWGLAFLLVGASEELMFRGFLQQTIARGLNFRWASLIMGAFFVAAHTGNGGETIIGLGLVLAAALVFSLSVWRTGAIWWGIGFHAAWDWAQSYFYGVADSGLASSHALMVSHPAGPTWLSGGSTGPEGSVLAIAAMLLSAGVIWLTLRKPDVDLDIKF